jgi:NAD-dependent SIR2 family protein deacetylase
MKTADMTLDGNAAAGILTEVFTAEATMATSVCEGCGATHRVGELVVYMHAPGLVIRCRTCGQVELRVVRARDRILVDLSGCRSLDFSA